MLKNIINFARCDNGIMMTFFKKKAMLEMDEIKSENHFKHQSLKKKRERERGISR